MNAPFVPNIKYFKKHRRRYPKGIHVNCYNAVYQYGIRVLTKGKIFSKHLEAIRKTITNFFKRNTKVYVRVFPNHSYTEKPNEVRRGRGKGSIEGWYYYAKLNSILIEFESASYDKAVEIMKIVRSKLPVKVDLWTKTREQYLEDRRNVQMLKQPNSFKELRKKQDLEKTKNSNE